jgi:hypothetical protein
MHAIESEHQFASALSERCAIVFLDFEWSGQASLSRAVVAEWERSWAIWNPHVQTRVWRVLPDQQPWIARWLPQDRGDLASGGHGALLWLVNGRIVAHEAAAYAAGIRELSRRTAAVFRDHSEPAVTAIERAPWRGPYHDFLVVDEAAVPRMSYFRAIGSGSAMQVADDLVRYLGDSLLWVQTYNPAKRETSLGLNYYGPTVVEPNELRQFARIVDAWAQLFRQAPDQFSVRGWWSPTESDYERLTFSRDHVVEVLERVASLAERVTTGKYLLHVGI